MAHERKTSTFPFSLNQNPSPNPPTQGQAYITDRTELVNEIMDNFRKILPSNYVAATNGPWYSLQFQAMAEQLADIQLQSTEISKDAFWDFTRSEFLWQVLGGLVFPSVSDNSGIPTIDGDVTYRTFLKEMVLLLLQGATRASIESGLEALDSDVIATVVERYLETAPRDPNGAYTIKDQFAIDVFIEGADNTFPADPIVLQENAALVIRALKPAHVLYAYSYLFREVFEQIASDEDGLSWDLDSYYYADLRKWCLGAKQITGTGDTLSDRTLFSDPDVSFKNIRAGAVLTISSGANAGQYRVVSTRALLSGASSTPVAYTLSSGGGGTLTATAEDIILDSTRDWGLLAVDTKVTIATGVNAGTYRLDTVLGSTGGPIGTPGISGTQVRLSPSTIKVERRMPSALTGQSYTVDVDRLGHQVPQTVSAEDVSIQFYL